MRRFAIWGFLLGAGAMLASALPDIRRYMRIRRM
jgi:hypothetical protein